MNMSEREARDIIHIIERRGQNLTAWEQRLISDVGRQEENLSFGQMEKIHQVYKARVK